MIKKIAPYFLLLMFSGVAIAQTAPINQNEEQSTNNIQENVSIEEKSENYIKEINKIRSLNLTPFQIDKWKNILVEYHRVMSEAETDEHKAYYQRKYKEALNRILREYQVEKIK